MEGQAKLADFGVAGQLTVSELKRLYKNELRHNLCKRLTPAWDTESVSVQIMS